MKPQDLHNFAEQVFAPNIKPTEPQTAAQAMADKVDTLGALRAVIADLQTHADQIRTELEDAGLAAIDGQHYSASFAPVKGRTVTNWEAVAAKFNPSAQLIRAHTTTGKPSTRLNVTARKITH
jgi:hypothetical protein